MRCLMVKSDNRLFVMICQKSPCLLGCYLWFIMIFCDSLWFTKIQQVLIIFRYWGLFFSDSCKQGSFWDPPMRILQSTKPESSSEGGRPSLQTMVCFWACTSWHRVVLFLFIFVKALMWCYVIWRDPMSVTMIQVRQKQTTCIWLND